MLRVNIRRISIPKFVKKYHLVPEKDGEKRFFFPHLGFINQVGEFHTFEDFYGDDDFDELVRPIACRDLIKVKKRRLGASQKEGE